MSQFFGSENIPNIVKASTTSVTLAATNGGSPTLIKVGGQGYSASATLTLSTAVSGAGGIDTGSIAANSTYYVYAVLSGGNLSLIASLATPSTGPSGFTSAYRAIGLFSTLAASTAIDFAMGLDPSVPGVKADASTTFIQPLTAFVPTADYRNLIINGNMDFWQRNTSAVGLTSGQYLADRWQYGKSGSVIENGSQDTIVPTAVESGMQSRFSYKQNITTNVPSLGASDYSAFIYNVEGHDYAALHGNPFRFQFWWRATVTGTFSVSFSNAASNRFYTTTFSCPTINTWQKVTIDVPANTTGTWNFDNTLGMVIYIVKAAGTSRQTSNINAWTNSGNLAANTQTNGVATIGNSFWISQVMLVPGAFPASANVPFERAGRTIQQELAMCQRYCQILELTQYYFAFSSSATAGVARTNITFPEMRATPNTTPDATSVTLVNIAANTSNVQTLTVQGLSKSSLGMFCTGTSNGVVYAFNGRVVTAEAEL